MAPVPERDLKSYLFSLLKRTSSIEAPTAQRLAARDEHHAPYGEGVTPFEAIPHKAVFIIIGLIGAGFVITGIWFFFWAKNGGFYFKETDWDDYKSTVLRRKGPNGTTLSGATESTDLGGGSIVHGEKRSVWGRRKKNVKRYKDFEDDESSQMTSSAGGSTLGSEMSELKKEKKRNKKSRKTRLRGGGLADEEMDMGVVDAMRAYRHEKPARVGGINKQPDGSAWDGSTNDGATATSDLMSHREPTPTNTPTKVKKERNDTYTGGTAGIRKVVSTSTPSSTSFWNRGSSTTTEQTEEERIKAEAKKLQDKGRAAQRRDFSFQAGDDSTVASDDRSTRREERERRRASRSPEKKKQQSVPGSYYADSDISSAVSGDTGTKSYQHHIPGLSSSGPAATDYAEERRKKRANGGGRYRRDRDELD